jgi:hypothetical protein
VSQTIITLTAMFFLSVAAWGQRGPRHGGHNPGPPAAGGRIGNPGGARGPGIYPVPQPRAYGSPHGYGNVVFPGTGHAPGTYSPFSIVDPSFGTRLSNTVSGFGNPYGNGYGYNYNYGRRPYGGGGNAVIVPYAYPVYVPYPEQPPVQYAPYAPQTQVVYVVPAEPPAPPRESVVTYVVPSRSSNESKPAKDEKRLYLIAFKNYSIYSATDYWVERGETIHYLTPYGAQNQASLDQIDLEFTERLNRERGIEFRLDKDR